MGSGAKSYEERLLFMVNAEMFSHVRERIVSL
jgi:hypothetical protein